MDDMVDFFSKLKESNDREYERLTWELAELKKSECSCKRDAVKYRIDRVFEILECNNKIKIILERLSEIMDRQEPKTT